MPVAKNMKELEKMLINECKRRIENIMKDYSECWYEGHSTMNKFLTKKEFWDLVKEYSKIQVNKGSGQRNKEIVVKFMVANTVVCPHELEENDRTIFDSLWKKFVEEYEPYMKQQTN